MEERIEANSGIVFQQLRVSLIIEMKKLLNGQPMDGFINYYISALEKSENHDQLKLISSSFFMAVDALKCLSPTAPANKEPSVDDIASGMGLMKVVGQNGRKIYIQKSKERVK